MDLAALPDQDLVQYVRLKDQNAYSEIIARFEAPILHYLTCFLGNELVANEVGQNAFLIAFENLNDYSTSFSLKVFFYKYAHEAALSYLSAHGKRGITESEQLLEELYRLDDIDAELLDNDFLKDLKKHLHKLPIKLRDVLVLHFLENLSYDEISDVIGVSLLAVENRVDSGRAKIIAYAKV